ncbi:MAG: autotransporter-associated beta strand repeat-containing protein [Chthoniobacterales bacterium]
MKTPTPSPNGKPATSTALRLRPLIFLLALAPAIHNASAQSAVTVGQNNVTATDPTDYLTPDVTKLTKVGTGTISLTGDSTYTAGTTISDGILQIGDGTTLGSIVGNVKDSAVFSFAHSDDIIFGGIISGAGSIQQNGSGNLTLTGANTYTGGTTINAGTLIIGDAKALGATTGALTINNMASIDLDGTNTSVGALNTIAGSILTSATLATLTTTSNANNTVAGQITGSLALAKAGTGALTLSNNTNSFTGGTTLKAGTLNLNVANALGAGSLTIVGASTIDNTSGALVTLNNNAQFWNSNFTFGGTNDLDLGTGTLTLSATRTLTLKTTKALFIGGEIAGATPTTGLTITGSSASGGAVVLTGTSTYGGTTTINNATLDIGNNGTTGALGTGKIVINKGGVIQYDRTNDTTLNNTISGVGSFTKASTGNLTLNGTNTYSGGTTIYDGTVTLGNSKALGAATGALAVRGGTLDLAGNSITVGDLNTHGSTGGVITNGTASTTSVLTDNAPSTSQNAIFGGVIQDGVGTVALVKTGTGWLTLNNANTYSGGTTLAAGRLFLNTANAIGTGALTISGAGILDNLAGTPITLATNNTQFWNSNFTADLANNLNLGTGMVTMNATRTVTVSEGVLTVGGVISGATPTTGLTKAGSETLVLTGDNSTGYTGTTTVTAGTLQIGDGTTIGVLGSGKVAVNATLAFNHSDDITVANIISGNTKGIVEQMGMGNLTLTGTNTYTGTTTVNTGGTLTVGNVRALGATTSSVALAGGTLDLNGLNPTIGSLTGSGTVTNNSVAASSILTTNTVGTKEFSGTIADGATSTVALVKGGSGTAALSGPNTYTGGTTLNAGTLALNNASAIGTGALTITKVSTIDNTSTMPVTLSTHNNQNWNADFTFKGTNDLDLGDGSVVMNGTRTVTTTAGTLSVDGVISATTSTYGLTKAGVGTLELNGANTYIGNTTVNAGTLAINNANALGYGSLVIAKTSALDNTSGMAVTLATNNTQNWNANFSFGSIIPFATDDLNLGTGGVLLGGTRIVTINQGILTVGGTISGAQSSYGLTTAGEGTLLLTGNNTFLGALTINVGSTVQLGDGSLNGSLATTKITNNSVLAFNQPIDKTFTSVISGKGSVVQNGPNILTLSRANNYTGGTVVNSGTVQLGSATGAGAATSPLTVNTDGMTSGTFDINGFTTTVGALSGTGGTILNNGSTAKVFTTSSTTSSAFAGTISDGLSQLSFTKAGTGTLTLTGANTYTGGTRINAGTLALGNGGMTGSIASTTIVNAGTLAINHSNAFSYAGIISGAGKVQQNGAGTTTLSGVNTYTGGTFVNTGTLTVASSSALGKGKVTLNGGTLQTDGVIHQINIGNDLTWDSAAQIALTLTTDSETSEFVNITGKVIGSDLDLDSLTFNFTPVALPPGDNDFLVMTATKGFGTLTAGDFAFVSSDMGLTGTFSIVGNSLFFNDGYDPSMGTGFANSGSFAPAPEPGTWMLLGLGLGAVIFFRRRNARVA